MSKNIYLLGDIHLGKNLRKNRNLRNLFIDNFKEAIEKIKLDNEELYVVFTGDVFDKEENDVDIYKVFLQSIKELAKQGNIKKILIITGNHDRYIKSIQISSIDLLEILESDKILFTSKEIKISEDDEFIYILLPYYDEYFVKLCGHHIFYIRLNNILGDNKKPKIIISHFPIYDYLPVDEKMLHLNDLKMYSDEYNIIAYLLGDLHGHELIKIDSKPYIIYSGALTQTSINDLINFKNGFKKIQIDCNRINVQSIFLKQLDVIECNQENFEKVKKLENIQDKIILTNDINIYNYFKDIALHTELSIYSNVVKELFTQNKDENKEFERIIDIKEYALKILKENVKNNDVYNILEKLIKLDLDSYKKNEQIVQAIIDIIEK